MPLVSEPASIARRSSRTNALVRWRGVSPPWQPTTRSSTSAKPLGHLEELEELEQAPHVGDDDRVGPLGGRLFVGDAEPLEAREDVVDVVDVDADLVGQGVG